MNGNLAIKEIHGREIIDSRGNPTVEVDVIPEGGVMGRAAVPSGASTGEHEAVELRDGTERYGGKGVQKALHHVEDVIGDLLVGVDVTSQEEIDDRMRTADGTKNKGRLGANAMLGVSMAAARSAANSLGLPFYRYLGEGNRLPCPMMNVLNGGRHSKNALDFQEFMIMPSGAESFREALRMGCEIYQSLKELLEADGLSTAVGDEGGFAPDLKDADQVFSYLERAVERAGYVPGKDVTFAMDAAASELYNPDSGLYDFPGESRMQELMEENPITRPDVDRTMITRTTEEMIEYYQKLCDKYPIRSIEDGLDENDWEGWGALTKALGNRIQLVGDDLFVTNPERLERGIREGIGNAILIKVNQIGTLTEARRAIEMAQKAGFGCIISHRSGETEDVTIADLSVATNAGQIKTGAPCRSERVAKYNQLLRIEEELGDKAAYGNPFCGK